VFFLTCITGPMWSGKSGLLIQNLERAKKTGFETRAYQPAVNTRDAVIRSRSGLEFPAEKISADLRGLNIEWAFDNKPSCIGLDEAMFFDKNNLRELVLELASRCSSGPSKIWLMVSGLDLDSDGRPWLAPEELCRSVANKGWPVDSIKLTSRCEPCSRPATMTFCKVKKEQRVLIGDEPFEPRCVSCWNFGEMSR
jgi:thymidine kinase